MNYPESLYSQHRSYKQGVLPQKVHVYSADVAANIDVLEVAYTVPSEYDLILENFVSYCAADAAQVAVGGYIQLFPDAANPRYLQREYFAGTRRYETMNYHGSIIVPNGWQVRFGYSFDSGINNNFIYASLVGLLIPRLE